MKKRIFSVLLLIGIVASVFALGASAYTHVLLTPDWVITEHGYPYTTQLAVETWCHAYDSYADTDNSRAIIDPSLSPIYEYYNYAEIMCNVEGVHDWVGQEWDYSNGPSYDPGEAKAISTEILSDDIYTDHGIAY